MRFSPTQLVAAAAVLLSLSIGAVALRAHEHSQLDSALSVAQTARLALDSANAHAAVADSVAVSANTQAHAAAAREQRAVALADSASRSLVTMRERYRVASAVVPDTCRPIKAAADSVLAVADSAIASEHAARVAADDRAAFLQVAFDTTHEALTNLRQVSARMSTAQILVEHAAKPPLLSRFLKAVAPRIGVGFAAGVDLHGSPSAVTGLTIGWSF